MPYARALLLLSLMIVLTAADEPPPEPLSATGWTVMLVSTIGMTLFFVWCIWKVLSTPGETEHVHSQADIDTHDQDT